MPSTSKVIILANPPVGDITADTFRLESQTLPELQDGQLLLKTIALGNEPGQRTWIDGNTALKRHYTTPVNKGDVVTAPGIAEIVESKFAEYKVGQKVSAMTDWREYKVINAEEIMGIAADIPNQSKFISLGQLGFSGSTAWVGVFKQMNLKPEHVVLVSGAAGAVGTAVVQIAKHVVGCKQVVGIAGGKSKCDWVKELGADECVDYKSESFAADLAAALPDYADCFYDNVGGAVLNEALAVVKRHGHITIGGCISAADFKGYHGKPLELTNWREVLYNRLTVKGFTLYDYGADVPQAKKELEQWIREGKLNVQRETVVEAKFEDVPKVWEGLFEGKNEGKLVTKLV